MKEINRRAADLEDRLVKLGPGLPVDDRVIYKNFNFFFRINYIIFGN